MLINSYAFDESRPWVGLSQIVTEARVASYSNIRNLASRRIEALLEENTHRFSQRYSFSFAATDATYILITDFCLESVL